MAVLTARVVPPVLARRRALHLIERNLMVHRRGWLVVVSGFFEPLFYLLSIGIGIGDLVGDVTLPGGGQVDYTAFVAPALLASSAMNGALYETTHNVFDKLKWRRTYDAILATPMSPLDVAVGEVGYALMRGSVYAAAFLLVMLSMGLVASWWALLAVPAALAVGFAFAGAGMAATSHMRDWQQLEWIFAAMLPLFLFSATFYPIDTYSPPVQAAVNLTPLYQGVDLIRSCTLGDMRPVLALRLLYLLAMGAGGLALANRRLGRLLLP